MRLMRFLKWLHPGMEIKRWILLSAVGLIMVGVGSAEFLMRETLGGKFIGAVILITGVVAVINGIRQMTRSIIAVFLPEGNKEFVNIVYQKRHLEKGPKIVTVGGGTGLSTLLHGLKNFTANITAIVTVTDDGGSSGRLRSQFNILPPGDIRNCLVALADAEPLMQQLFQYRFDESTELKGHNFGNLFITVLSQVTGDFEQAVKESSKVLAIRGRVVPSTLKKVTLVAEHKDGSVTLGETRLTKSKSPVSKLSLKPSGCKPTQEALDAIRDADAIVIGPGSLYTSVIPDLLVEDVVEAIERSKGLKIYVCNVMTQSGETDNYTAFDHIKTLVDTTSPKVIEKCIVNTGRVPEEMLKKYEEENACPVVPDTDKIRDFGYSVVEENVIDTKNYVRHDSDRLSRIIVELIEEHKMKVL